MSLADVVPIVDDVDDISVWARHQEADDHDGSADMNLADVVPVVDDVDDVSV